MTKKTVTANETNTTAGVSDTRSISAKKRWRKVNRTMKFMCSTVPRRKAKAFLESRKRPGGGTDVKKKRRLEDPRLLEGTVKRVKKRELKDNIKVMVRLRPLLCGEKRTTNIELSTVQNLVRLKPTRFGKPVPEQYHFDRVFDQSTTQEMIFEHAVEPILDEVLKGFNCTIFCYGLTGTGKTHTMEGEISNDNLSNCPNAGIIPRAVHRIFEKINQLNFVDDLDLSILNESFMEKDEYVATVSVSHLEIYNENLTDLLSASDKNLSIYSQALRKKAVFVQHLEEIVVADASDIFAILDKSVKKRRVAATEKNERSSRSHCIFTLNVKLKEIGKLRGEDLLRTGTLNLVDLAGSEGAPAIGDNLDRRRESCYINTSLLVLGRVITALTTNQNHIPYRDSKLTRLLQESFGGKSKTVIIATLSETSPMEHLYHTLQYSSRAKNIQNKPEVNEKVTKKRYVQELLRQITCLKDDLKSSQTRNGIYLSEERLTEMKNSIAELKENVFSKVKQIQGQYQKIRMYKTQSLQFDRTKEELDKQLKEKQNESKKLQSIIERQREESRTNEAKREEIRSTLSEIAEKAVNFKLQHALSIQQIRTTVSTGTSEEFEECSKIVQSLRSVHNNVVLQIGKLEQNLKSRILGLDANVLNLLKSEISKHCEQSQKLLKELESDLERTVQAVAEKKSSSAKKADAMLKELIQSQGSYTGRFEAELKQFGIMATKARQANIGHINLSNEKKLAILDGMEKKMLAELVSVVTNKMSELREGLKVPTSEETLQKHQAEMNKHVEKMMTSHASWTSKHKELTQQTSQSIASLANIPTIPVEKILSSCSAIRAEMNLVPGLCKVSPATQSPVLATAEMLTNEVSKIRESVETKASNSVDALGDLHDKLKKNCQSYTEIAEELDAMENVSGMLFEVTEAGNEKLSASCEDITAPIGSPEESDQYERCIRPPKHFAAYSDDWRSLEGFSQSFIIGLKRYTEFAASTVS